MTAQNQGTEPGLPPGQWEDLFRKARIQVEALDAARSRRARETLLGHFRARNLDREVPIEVDGRQGKARLRAVDAGRRQKRYFFEVSWDGEGPPDPRDRPAPDAPPSTPARGPTAEPPARRPRPKERAGPPLAAVAAGLPGPARNGSGNAEDWS